LDTLDFVELKQNLFSLGMATFLGATLGVDRDLHHKPAGIRVLALVSLGAAAIALGSAYAVSGFGNVPAEGVLRTIQGVLSGIGFLGAGVIMRAQKEEVHGITTAASIWLAAILGMICGMGQWMLAACAFAFAWVIMIFGRWAEMMVMRMVPPPPSNSNHMEHHKQSHE
jgi:putative Mg2+ transporter-C (MgtC) family protein